MDGQRFDELAKALAVGHSRRRLLKGLVGAALGGAFTTAGLRDAIAQARCPREAPINCNGTCTDLRTDTENCGRCGQACDAEEACYAGRCLSDCPRGFVTCDGSCVRECSGDQLLNPATCTCEDEPEFCGGIGASCDEINDPICCAGLACEEGVCVGAGQCSANREECGLGEDGPFCCEGLRCLFLFCCPAAGDPCTVSEECCPLLNLECVDGTCQPPE